MLCLFVVVNDAIFRQYFQKNGCVSVLEVFVEMSGMIGRLADNSVAVREGGGDADDGEDIAKMLETFLQRLQFNLLTLVKLAAEKPVKSGKKSAKSGQRVANTNLKDLYASTLRLSGKSENLAKSIFDVLQVLSKEMSSLK